MENASKALIIAGGILIGILILSLLVYTFTNYGSFTGGQSRKEEQQQLIAFNQQYEEKMKDNLKASDIISIINRAKNNNAKYELVDGDFGNQYYIQIEVINARDESSFANYSERTTKANLYDRLLKYNSGANQFFKYKEPASGESAYNDSGRICKLVFEYYET